jgi:simple sugar transport system permease protein
MVILTAGIDLSVGSMVSLSSVICAMLLMERNWTKAASLTVPVFALFSLFVGYTIINRITRRFRMRPGSANIVGLLFGICTGVIVFILCHRQVPTGFGTLFVLLVVPVFGIFLGMLNGLIIAKGKIQPFIVTLGMMSAAVGLAKFVAGKGGQIHPIYYEAAGYSAEGTSQVAPQSFDLLSGKISLFGIDIFPVAGLFFLAAVFIVHFILTRLRMGRHIYAIGGNEETARLSGINVDRVKTIVYGISGGLSALAGVLYCASYTQGKSDAGATWELDAIAAVVIGGTSLMGGRGSVIGTMVGVLILGYLGNILNLQEVPSEVQDILKGVIIIGAVLLQEGTVVRWLRSIMKKRS